jgi:hypothetical protein
MGERVHAAWTDSYRTGILLLDITAEFPGIATATLVNGKKPELLLAMGIGNVAVVWGFDGHTVWFC